MYSGFCKGGGAKISGITVFETAGCKLKIPVSCFGNAGAKKTNLACSLFWSDFNFNSTCLSSQQGFLLKECFIPHCFSGTDESLISFSLPQQ